MAELSGLQLRQGLESILHREPRLTRFLRELLSNSGHFLILNSLADITTDGWLAYLTDPTEYLLIGALLLQTAYLSRPTAAKFPGNLIGVSLYTAIDIWGDGLAFFESPSHWVFWIFSLTIALLQGMRYNWRPTWETWVIPLESVVRLLMVLFFYFVIQVDGQPITGLRWADFRQFMTENTHGFLGASLVLVGLLLGFRQLQAVKQQRQLQQTAVLLRNLAEWGMGSHAVATAVMNPERLAFQQCERAILFMDIRGFTVWCEQNSPQTVAKTLNDYYQKVEPAVSDYQPLRTTFTGDEIMAIYATAQQAVAAARAMQAAAIAVLSPHHIGAGCGVHYGTVVEGLFGGQDVRTYTVIGDVVNTAKRIEGATPAGEITVSDAVYCQLGRQVAVKAPKSVKLKGKAEPLTTWLLA